MSTFSQLGIRKEYIKALKELGINEPTEIQEKAIPELLDSKTDFTGLAQTGTGKTAAFGLPILHAIDGSKDEVLQPRIYTTYAYPITYKRSSKVECRKCKLHYNSIKPTP